MRTVLKETAPTVELGQNLLRESPSAIVLRNLFDKIAVPDWLRFEQSRGGEVGELLVTSSVLCTPKDPQAAEGLEHLYSSVGFDGKRILIDATPALVNENRKSWSKSKSHPDVIFWAESPDPEGDLILFGRGEFIGTSGIWTPNAEGKYVESNPGYCNYVGKRAYALFRSELIAASEGEPRARVVEIQTVQSTEPPTDLYNLN